MGDRHERDKTTFRPPPEIKEAAQKILDERPGWTLNDFLTACLALLAKNPDAMLNRLSEFRPPRRVGRPRKKTPPAQ